MIKQVHLVRFKKYKEQTFDLHPTGVSLLVGGNNAGKSTLIHALAVWEFCKTVLLHEKGNRVFCSTEVGKGDGLGMSAEEFLPIAVPSLNHLWTNLKTQLSPDEKRSWPDAFSGYIMRIKCTWDFQSQIDKYMEIGLSLVNDRLFIRVTQSNLTEEDYIPTIVYLPTFAGILPKENKVTMAERRAFLGKGMAGSIIRNMVYDLYDADRKQYKELLRGRRRLSREEKEMFISKSPFQMLQENLRSVFSSELEVEPFNENFHTVIKVNERKIIKENNETKALAKTKYTPRDIISQGSGYLQWLSIFCILLSPNVDILLLDEPDAHLHASLQSELLKYIVNAISGENSEKQILVSTHSVEMIKQASLDVIFSMDERKYLVEESSRVAVLHGIGSEYFPKIDLLKKHKNLLFLENESDYKILEILGAKCGINFPQNIVIWANTGSHADRRKIFDELKKSIPDLKCISLRDRDMDNPDIIGEGLVYKGISLQKDSQILLLEWRRKNIESYLLCPQAIAIASKKTVKEIKQYFKDSFALAIDDDGYVDADPPEAIITLDGKHHFTDRVVGLEHKFNCNKYDVAQCFTSDEVCNDVKVFLTRVNSFFAREESDT